MKTNSLRAIAMKYASNGIRVLPLDPYSDVPIRDIELGLVHGYDNATSDLEKVAAIWQKYPDAGIGVSSTLIDYHIITAETLAEQLARRQRIRDKLPDSLKNNIKVDHE